MKIGHRQLVENCATATTINLHSLVPDADGVTLPGPKAWVSTGGSDTRTDAPVGRRPRRRPAAARDPDTIEEEVYEDDPA